MLIRALHCGLLLGILGLLGAPGQSFSQPAFAAIPELRNQETLTLAQDIRYLSEVQPVLTFDTIRSREFPGYLKGSPNFSWTRLTYWLRLEIIKQNNDPYILEIGYPLLDELDIYVEREGQLVRHEVLGDQQQGTLQFTNAIKPAFKFPTESGHYRLTLRVRSSSSVQIPLTFFQETKYHNKMLEDFAYLFAYGGAVAIMIIYNFFIYLETRSRTYFFYVSFIVFFLALQVALSGVGQVYLWPEAWSNLIIGHFSYLMNFFVYQFSLAFLDLKTRPLLARSLKILSAITIVAFFLSLLLPYGLSVRITASLTFFTAIALIAVAILVTFVDRSREGWFYLIAWGSFLVGCVIYLSKQWGWLPNNQWTHNAFMIGNITEIALLSFALADRFNRLQKRAREADQARAEAEAELSLSLKTRVYLVSDMAHRMNNPLNYISTNQASLIKEIDDLRTDMIHVLEEWRPCDRPEQYELARRHFAQRFESMKQSMDLMEEGVRRSASSVVAIRQLSGVDGYQLDRLHIDEILRVAQERIAENLGKMALARIQVLNDLAQAEVYTNRFAIPMVIELIFRNWVNASTSHEILKVDLAVDSLGKPSLIMRMNYRSDDQIRHMIEQVLPFLNQILRPYESVIRWTLQDTSLEFMLTFGKEKTELVLREAA